MKESAFQVTESTTGDGILSDEDTNLQLTSSDVKSRTPNGHANVSGVPAIPTLSDSATRNQVRTKSSGKLETTFSTPTSSASRVSFRHRVSDTYDKTSVSKTNLSVSKTYPKSCLLSKRKGTETNLSNVREPSSKMVENGLNKSGSFERKADPNEILKSVCWSHNSKNRIVSTT